ncbi:hypothetical protein ES708_28077 [subsurface metagenome]
MGSMTYVKADVVAVGAAASAAVVVDLGLGIDEAARILGVLIDVSMVGVLLPGIEMRAQAAYSFDPEDLVFAAADDEQFASCEVAVTAIAASVGATKQSEHAFSNFVGMNVVTTRNLALVLTATALPATVSGKVYYERYKPTAMDLVQLIATRR